MRPFLIGSSNLKHHGTNLNCVYIPATNVQTLINRAHPQNVNFFEGLQWLTSDCKIIISTTNNSIHYDTHKKGWHCPEPKLVTGNTLFSLSKIFNQNEFFKLNRDAEVRSIFDPERKLIEFFNHLRTRLRQVGVTSWKDRIVILPTPPRHTYRCCSETSHKIVSRHASEFVVESIYGRVIKRFNTDANCNFIRLDSKMNK